MEGTAPAWQNVNANMRKAVAAFNLQKVALEIDRTDLEVYSDPMFGKVFHNLFDNALRHWGEAMTVIRISSHESGERLVLVFEDDGAGVSPDDKQHLFEQGFGKHTGLGLSLSREILSITGITIAESGTPGSGARFEMGVPPGSYRYENV